tara:strand:- start:2571 stop:2981 length:411 start_codon:yes stop_codon:yes gene_type:complete
MVFRTSFGMYVPLDYETYMKLKKIKAVINLSRIQSIRFDKWVRKLPHNRTKPEPFAPCPVFWKKKKKQYIDVDYYAGTDISHQKFYDAWKVAATPKDSPEDVQAPELDWKIVDGVYDECFEWFQGFIQKRSKMSMK